MSVVLDNIRELVRDQWVTALKSALMSMTSGAFEITLPEGPHSAGPEKQEQGWFWYSQVLSISPASTIWVGAANGTWTTLGKSLLMSHGLEEASPQDIQSSCADIVAQSNGALAHGLTKRFGSEITCGDLVPSKQPDGSQSIILTLAAATLPRAISIAVSFDESIFTFLSRLSQGRTNELPSAPPVPSSISDLRLNLHVTLGKTELLLDSILKLSVGSVIDIGRSVNDFVDVVANGKVIASGQVVAFRGNYAIKVVSTRSKTDASRAVFQSSDEFGISGPSGVGGGSQLPENVEGYDA
jgi:flagellar motor switch protein FliN/FliY